MEMFMKTLKKLSVLLLPLVLLFSQASLAQEEGCGKLLKMCAKALPANAAAIKHALKACKPLRQCRSECRQEKRSCKSECRTLKGAEKRQCKAECRGTKKVCKDECRVSYKTQECGVAQLALGGSAAKTVIACKEAAACIRENMK